MIHVPRLVRAVARRTPRRVLPNRLRASDVAVTLAILVLAALTGAARAQSSSSGALPAAAPASGAASDATDPSTSPDGAGASSTLRFNGFGTVSAVSVSPQDGWGFRRETTASAHHDDGVRADVDSRLGLQLGWRPAPQWEVVGQVVLKPEADNAKWTQGITWAFAAWHPTPDWTVRVGRTSPDVFLLADARNVGFSYPWMRPNVEFYSWVPIENVDGIDITREGALWDGRWTAKAFLGRSSVTMGSNHDDGDTEGRIEPFAGTTLTWERDGLTLKASYAYARTRSLNPDSITMLRGALTQIATIPVPGVAEDALALRDSIPASYFLTRYAALGASWDAGPWLLQAEGARITGNFIASNAWYGYASVGYRLGNATVFGMAGRGKTMVSPLVHPEWGTTLAPFIGPEAAAQAQALADRISNDSNYGRVDQRSFSLGLRYDLSAQLALKLQADHVSSSPYGGGLWAYGTYAAHRGDVFSAGLDFIF